MKAAANGGLNLSILDGWWDEGYNPELGWPIGNGETYDDHDYQDTVEAASLYDRLEADVVPMFYDRSPEGLPRDWIRRMKRSIAECSAFFNSHRMVQEYTESIYLKAAERAAESFARTRVVAAWQKNVQNAWPFIKIELDSDAPDGDHKLDEPLNVQARVQLGKLTPEDVEVQLYLGRVTSAGTIEEPHIVVMHTNGTTYKNAYVYRALEVTCNRSGFMGYTVRVLPKKSDSVAPPISALVTWAGDTP